MKIFLAKLRSCPGFRDGCWGQNLGREEDGGGAVREPERLGKGRVRRGRWRRGGTSRGKVRPRCEMFKLRVFPASGCPLYSPAEGPPEVGG